MCADAPPPAYAGPGDAHSQQEWVWRRRDYAALFAEAPEETLRLESTPFYLYLANARRRIAEELPDARLIAVVRDPIDRAYSNWMHLWVDGLEPSATSWPRGTPRTSGWTRAGHRSGTTAGWDDTASSCRTCSRGWTGNGCWCCATGSWSPSRPRRWTGSAASLASPRARSARCQPDNSRPFVGPGPADGGHRPDHPEPARRWASICRRPCLAAGEQAAGGCAAVSRKAPSAGARSGAAGGIARRLCGGHRAARGGARRVLPGLALDHRTRRVRGSHLSSPR